MNITIVQTFTDGFTTYQSGQELSVPSEVAQRWIADGKAQADTDGQQSWLSSTEVAATRALVSGDRTADATSRGITASDNGKTLAPTGALTYTIPAGLSPAPSFTVDCPASGTITIARSGGATLNGAGTSLTRTRASNPVGFVVLAHVETDSYGVSGA